MGDIKIIKSTTLFRADEEFNDPRYMRVRIAVCHTGLNLNNSYISNEAVTNAVNTLKNIPILADVVKKQDGSLDYSGHTMQIVDDEFHEGEQRINYIEKVVGIIPETNEFELVYDEESEKYYVYCTAFLFRDYGNYAVDILEQRGGQTDVSCELYCNEISYNAKEKYTCIDDFMFMGVTLLGSDKQPGMQGAHAKTFAEQEDTAREEQMFVIMKELAFALNNFNRSNASKGGKEKLTKFEELLTLYNLTVEDIEFEYEGLSDEELEAKFTEAFDKNDTTDAVKTGDENDDTDDKPEDDEDPENTNNDDPGDEDPNAEYQKVNVYQIDEIGNITITFAVSHEDIRAALYQLVSQYAQMDNDWYFVDKVFDNYFEFVNWDGNKIYRQSYKKDGDIISFDGERLELYQERLTATEKAALDDIRSNYSIMVADDFKRQRDEIFNSEEYKVLQDNEAFKALKDISEKFSVSDIKTQCKLIFADYVLMQGQFSKQQTEEKKLHKINFSLEDNKEQIKRPYGNLFDGIKKTK